MMTFAIVPRVSPAFSRAQRPQYKPVWSWTEAGFPQETQHPEAVIRSSV
jgi:hypothetical protein